MNVETQIHLDRWKPRAYQLPICDALENKHYKRILCIMPRRAGKDITAWNLMIRAALRKVGVYYYIFPTYAQAKKVIWDSITNDGQRFIDFIPSELVASSNSQELKIRFTNGSLIQLVGSDNVDSLMGTNPRGIVFSEYALQDPRAYPLLRPILAVNQGWALFISTPRGKNHLWEMYEIARNSPDWFAYKLTITDTHHVPLLEIQKDLHEGLISEDLIQQEYYTSFDMGVEGAYYAKYLDKMRMNNQIGKVPYESAFRVFTSWDLGVRDSTSIIFYQLIGQTIRIIDYYEKSKEGLEHYAKILAQKEYQYAKHFAPHDINVVEFGTGISRYEKALALGIKFEMRTGRNGEKVSAVPGLSVEDGIEAVRSLFSRVWIDEEKCFQLIKCLENYRQEYDSKKKIYNSRPLHNFASHGADAMRYLALSVPRTRDNLTAEDLDKRYHDAVYGGRIPSVFDDQAGFY